MLQEGSREADYNMISLSCLFSSLMWMLIETRGETNRGGRTGGSEKYAAVFFPPYFDF